MIGVNKYNFKHPSHISLFNIYDSLPFPSVKGKILRDVINNDLNFIEWALTSSRIFCFDDYTYEFILSKEIILSKSAIKRQIEKRNEFNNAVLEFNSNFKENGIFSPYNDRIKLYCLNYRLSFGLFAGKTLEEVIELSPGKIEFYIHSLPWFGLDQRSINKLLTNSRSFIFLKTTLQLLEHKYIIAPDHMKGFVDKRPQMDGEYSNEIESDYAGSYAYDVEGLSDDFIDDVLDGDPDAYWNLD